MILQQASDKLLNLLTITETWKNKLIELLIFNVHVLFKLSCAESKTKQNKTNTTLSDIMADV